MTILVLHGTTLWRASQIVVDGPDPAYREPFDLRESEGFCVTPEMEDYPLGSPEYYARKKANLFPNEGGPVILEMEIEESILHKCMTETREYQFEEDYGIEEAWPTIPKRIRILTPED
jgi:hypothetical protein